MKFDALTGLLTHNAVAERLGSTSPFGAAFDIDGLAWATQELGHRHSDQILVCVGRVVEGAARARGGEAFRIGGDEFLAVLPGATHVDALEVARSVIRDVAALQLAYRRWDDCSRRHVVTNAVVCRVTAGWTARILTAREWVANQICQAKEANDGRPGVVADAGDDVPAWMLEP